MSVRFRPVLAIGVCAALAAATGVASAAAPKAKPVCNLITDDKDDAGVVTAQPGMDILSADVASDKKNVTAVFRLAGPPSAPNPQAPGGTDYYFSFTTSDASDPQFLHMSLPPVGAPTFATGQTTSVGGQNTSSDDADAVTGSVTGSVVTITAPISAFGGRINLKAGHKLTGLTAEVFAQVGVPGVGGLLENVDTASGSKSYVAGTPSCVVPGKG